MEVINQCLNYFTYLESFLRIAINQLQLESTQHMHDHLLSFIKQKRSIQVKYEGHVARIIMFFEGDAVYPEALARLTFALHVQPCYLRGSQFSVSAQLHL